MEVGGRPLARSTPDARSPTDWFEAVRSDTSRSGPAGHQLADMARPINYTPGSEPYTLPKLFERRLSLFYGEIRRITSDFLDFWDFRGFLFFRASQCWDTVSADGSQQYSAVADL